MRILLIDDDKHIATTLASELSAFYVVETALLGEEGEYLAQVNTYDLIILDMMLPDISGIQICSQLRENNIKTPILILSGKYEVQDKVTALDAGADDYLTKPFHFKELLARIRALLRRHPETLATNILKVDDLIIDLNRKLVRRGKESIYLRRKEFDLLEYLARNVGCVLTRDMILDHVWDSTNDSLTNTIDVHIKHLRDRIDKPFPKKLIKTERGLGYKLEA